MDLKPSAPQVTDSALRLPPDFPELPGEVTERFPEMNGWMDGVNRFWKQNVNAVDDFARAILDVQHVGGVLNVDPNEGSIYVKTTKGAGGFRDPDTPFYVDSQGRFSLGANLYWQDGRLVISSDGGGVGIVDWSDITNIPGELTDGRIPAAINSAGLVISGVAPGIVVSASGVAGLYLGSDFLGYYNGTSWKTYMDNAGNFYLGGTSGSLQWNGTTLIISGAVNATTGSIGGFSIQSDHIRDTANSFGLASTITGGDDVRFWAGAPFASRGSAPFRVTEGGAMNAISGSIGGFVITSTNLTAGVLGVSSYLQISSATGVCTWATNVATPNKVIIGGNAITGTNGAIHNTFTLWQAAGVGELLLYSGAGGGPTIDIYGGDGSILAGNGSTSAPTYAFMSDPTTGWRWNSSGDMRAVTNGSDRLVVRNGAIVCIVPLKLNNSNTLSGIAQTGFVTIQDSTGSTIRLLTG